MPFLFAFIALILASEVLCILLAEDADVESSRKIKNQRFSPMGLLLLLTLSRRITNMTTPQTRIQLSDGESNVMRKLDLKFRPIVLERVVDIYRVLQSMHSNKIYARDVALHKMWS